VAGTWFRKRIARVVAVSSATAFLITVFVVGASGAGSRYPGLGPASQRALAAEPGRSAPSGPSKSTKVAVFLQLDIESTLSVYNAALSSGKASAHAAAATQLGRIKAEQDSVLSAAAAAAPGMKQLYRTQSVISGVAITTDAGNLGALAKIAGVKAAVLIVPKHASNSYAVPLVHAPEAWTAHSNLGQNSTIAIIDTGIDYTHANFAGPGTSTAYDTALATDDAPANPLWFPSAKIIGGYDFAGDNYDADPTSPSYQPVPAPDPNPLDCNGHGSHVSGTAAGFGVTSGGATFTGPYDTGTAFSSLRIGPGMAPHALLYAYKVFGCEGSTDVVGEAIDRAGDPNQDGDPSDHANVINMSLGADYGSPEDADSVATNAAVDLGINVVVASGNGGDYYDVGGSPGDAVKSIAVANSVDAYSQIDSVHVSSPPSIVGDYGAERSVAYDWGSDPDLAGTLVALSSATNKDGCDVLSPTDAAAVNGKVAFLEWTDDDTVRRCGSATRSGHVAAAGAIGAVFADDEETFAAGITGSAVIPVVMVVKSAGDTIRAHLADPVVVSGTSANSYRQLIPADNDKVNTSSSRGVRGAGNVKPDVTAVGTSVFSTAMGTGNEGVSFTGTSMATPMVAGLAALVTTEHPNWSTTEVKADIMNTAGQDLYTGQNHTGTVYAPNRVGAGRIQADSALDNSVVAYVVDDPGAVSVSFGPVAVTAPMTLTKTVKVVNKGLSSATYSVAYDALTTVPGVSYQLSTASITVGALSSNTFTVSFVVTDPSLLTKTIDPTMSLSQAGLPRNFLADASGRIVLTSGGRPSLRVPVYAAPRPASTMSQKSSIKLGSGVHTKQVKLKGHGVAQGSGATEVDSLVAGFELQAESGALSLCSQSPGGTSCLRAPDERAADIHYVGSSSDSGLTYFAISTYGPWRTEASANEFDIYIDTTGDSTPDAVMFNTRLAGQDIFVSELLDLNTFDVLDVEGINNVLGDVDTAEFDSDVLVMPLTTSLLPGIGSHPKIRYGVVSFSSVGGGATDSVGLKPNGSLNNQLSADTSAPGIVVTGSAAGPIAPLFSDQPGETLSVQRDSQAYKSSNGLGVLLFHYQNAVGSKAQVVKIKG
jgi:subtilisin family serine protease